MINVMHLNAGLAVSASTLLTLRASSSGIVPAGAATFAGGSGVFVMDSMSGTSGAIVFNADSVSPGNGTLTVATGKTVSSGNSAVTITAWDLDLDGSLDLGTGAAEIHGAQTSQTIGVGTVSAMDMHIVDAELGRITSSGGLTIGSATSGSLTVNALTDTNTDSLGTVSLVASGGSAKVIFLAASDSSVFSKGIVVNAGAGAEIGQAVTTKAVTVVNAGAGTLTVATGKQLSSTNQLLTITADDIDLVGTINTGTSSLTIGCSTADRTVGVGTGSGELSVDANELAAITSAGLLIGNSMCGVQTVSDIESSDSAAISGVVSFVASRNEKNCHIQWCIFDIRYTECTS
jgi:hypothetical protein